MKCKVRFFPDKKNAEANSGETILSAAISAGIFLNSSCGGEGVCGRCKAKVKKGKFHMEPTGRISPTEAKKGYCLACMATIEGDLEVEIPKESRLELKEPAKADDKYHLKGLYSKSQDIDLVTLPSNDKLECPLATKSYLDLTPPNLNDNIGDLERTARQLKTKYNITIDKTNLVNVRRLPEILRSSDWKVTATVDCLDDHNELIAVEPGDTTQTNFGIAVDIGTTTVSAQLVDLNSGQILGTKVAFNRQAAFGADVISRIVFAQETYGLERLHDAIVDTLNNMIQDLSQEHKVNLNEISCIYCAGNTTMMHLLFEINPASIRREPYVAVTNFMPLVKVSEVGIRVNPSAILKCSPCVASYVGGDTTAGVLASGMTESDEVSLFIDIGTNGEITLGNREWLVCCAASAGPAFEGSGLTSGMRAVKGAIQKVKINKNNLASQVTVIGDVTAQGICGSGYIDLLAEMLENNIIDKSGKINAHLKNPLIRVKNDIPEYSVVKAKGKDEIVVNEADIENLKMAKAAIFAASFILTKHVQIKLEDIKHIYIAGGFGTFLNMQSAIDIGLLPDLPKEKFLFLGNASLVGARRSLLSKEARKKVDEIAKKMTYFELSADPKYMDEYMAALFFPHTDITRFGAKK